MSEKRYPTTDDRIAQAYAKLPAMRENAKRLCDLGVHCGVNPDSVLTYFEADPLAKVADAYELVVHLAALSTAQEIQATTGVEPVRGLAEIHDDAITQARAIVKGE